MVNCVVAHNQRINSIFIAINFSLSSNTISLTFFSLRGCVTLFSFCCFHLSLIFHPTKIWRRRSKQLWFFFSVVVRLKWTWREKLCAHCSIWLTFHFEFGSHSSPRLFVRYFFFSSHFGPCHICIALLCLCIETTFGIKNSWVLMCIFNVTKHKWMPTGKRVQ